MQLKATVTETDQGSFTAIASTYGIDRQNEIVARGAFKETIRRWRDSGQQLPLAWNHDLSAENLIGEVDPEQTKETPEGLLVAGQLDLGASPIADEAWRSVKAGRIGLSIGFLIEDERVNAAGNRELTQIDLLEVSLTASPSNSDTRILETKSLQPPIRLVIFELW